MPASTPIEQAPTPLQFGRVGTSGTAPDHGAVLIEWELKRNCSMSPKQVLAVYASLCVISLVIATYFWMLGARLVMPFAWVELLCVGAALLVYARHADDAECVALRADRLTVEWRNGGRVERVEFLPEWVRIEPRRDDRSLIELLGQGQVIEVGRFVRPELRRALAEELRAAVRHGPLGWRRKASETEKLGNEP
ncbi:MAG TPA: DUF2244 domain-containing protein [Methylibium sp.]|nr:DUF2244 domain-containing protein [Methylibium sp.]